MSTEFNRILTTIDNTIKNTIKNTTNSTITSVNTIVNRYCMLHFLFMRSTINRTSKNTIATMLTTSIMQALVELSTLSCRLMLSCVALHFLLLVLLAEMIPFHGLLCFHNNPRIHSTVAQHFSTTPVQLPGGGDTCSRQRCEIPRESGFRMDSIRIEF